MEGLILPALLFAGMWFLLIRPQQQKLKQQRETISAASAGDRVLMQSGIYGTLTEVDEHSVYLEVAEGIELLMARSMIQDILTHFPGEDAPQDAETED